MDTPKSTQKKLTLLVLAAGIGSRYGGIKQIDGFGPNGETIMDYSLYDAIRAGFTKVVFIVRDEIQDTVKEMFLPRLQGKVEVQFVIQSLDKLIPEEFRNADRQKPWGTGHAMLCAKDVIDEPFAVINADDFYGRESFRAVAQHFAEDKEGAHALVGYTLKDVLSEHGSVSRGCGEQDANGYLISVVERTKILKENGKIIAREPDGDIVMDPETPTSMNFWGFYPSIFPIAGEMFIDFLREKHKEPKSEFFIPLFVNRMVKEGRGKVRIVSGGHTWFGVTYQEDKNMVSSRIQELVDKGEYPAKLWS
ncbi:MAG: nucleotidyltransferase [Cyclobacteriaceae bacterium]|nr:nucleotidyltransferase [Cyclobacteriaceae bacterium]